MYSPDDQARETITMLRESQEALVDQEAIEGFVARPSSEYTISMPSLQGSLRAVRCRCLLVTLSFCVFRDELMFAALYELQDRKGHLKST